MEEVRGSNRTIVVNNDRARPNFVRVRTMQDQDGQFN